MSLNVCFCLQSEKEPSFVSDPLSIPVQTWMTFPSRSAVGAPTCRQCNYSPPSEQPAGSEQMSKIPCWVIWFIYNCRHFQSPSPACLPITEPGSNLILPYQAGRARAAAYIVLHWFSWAEIRVADRKHDPGGMWDSLNMISGVSTCDTKQVHTPTHGGR